jgi:TRAP-type transport system periplasmic protein
MKYNHRNYWILLGLSLVIIIAMLAGCSAPTTSSAPAKSSAAPAAPTTSAAPAAPATSAAPATAAPKPSTSAPATSAAPAAGAKTIELRLAHAWATNHLMHIVIQNWADEVNKATEGRVKITIYPGGSLSTAVQLYDSAASGVVDMVWMLHGYTPGKFPMTSVIELPFMGNSALNSTRILADLMAKYPQFAKEHEGVKVLYIWGIDNGQLMTTNKPVKVMEDVKGLKLRTGSASQSPMAEAIGAVPVLMNISDLYDSLQKGVIQGTLLGHSAIKTFNLKDIIKNMTMINLFTNTQAVVINNNSWSKIPKQDQDIIDKLSGQRMSEVSANAYLAEADAALKMAQDAKMNIYTPPADELARWKQAMTPIYQQWVKDMNAKGLPGQAVFDDAMKLNDKYK